MSLITFLSMAGVAVGVSTLIIILSVMDGFEGALKSRLAQGEFHILVTHVNDEQEPYFEFPVEKVGSIYNLSKDILSVNPVLATEAIIKAGSKVAGVSLRGISESHANLLSKTLVEATERPHNLSRDGIWLGKEIALQLRVFTGDKIQIISPTETEGPMESVPRLRIFKVEGIFESGLPEKDIHTAYASAEAVQDFLQRPQKVNRLEISVQNFAESGATADAIRSDLGSGFLVKDWNQLNAHLFASLRLERITMFLILTMIILVASFNIVTSLKMTVIEKRKEISILQAMGATPRQLAGIFLIQGAVIGNVGTVVGLLLGVGTCYYLKVHPVIELPDVFFDRSLPVNISPPFVLGVTFTAVCIVLLAAFFPARSAAKIPPLEGIRNI